MSKFNAKKVTTTTMLALVAMAMIGCGGSGGSGGPGTGMGDNQDAEYKAALAEFEAADKASEAMEADTLAKEGQSSWTRFNANGETKPLELKGFVTYRPSASNPWTAGISMFHGGPMRWPHLERIQLSRPTEGSLDGTTMTAKGQGRMLIRYMDGSRRRSATVDGIVEVRLTDAAPDHTAGDNYQFAFTPDPRDRDRRHLPQVNVSSSGRTELAPRTITYGRGIWVTGR